MPLKEKSWVVGAGGAVIDGAEVEGDGAGVAVGGEGVDPGASGVAEAEEFGDFVEGFAGGVVYGAAYVFVVPGGFPARAGPGRGGCGLRRLRGRGGVTPPQTVMQSEVGHPGCCGFH